MIYIRGHASDYDDWSALGNSGWSYDECLPYFRRSEGWQGPPNPYHGQDGRPLKTSRHGLLHPLSQAFVEAGVQASFPETSDFNGDQQESFGPCDSTVDTSTLRAVRSSAARSYLRPVRGRSNLTVITRALASKVIVENGRARGIEYIRGRNVHRLRADREVILSGGAINSPQLLQLSGIGSTAHLSSLGIHIVADLPGVGQNLQDHLAVALRQRIKTPISLLTHVRSLNAAVALGRYFLIGGGPAAHHGVEALAFLKSAPARRARCPVSFRDDHVRRSRS
jgi:choline dehydrogenase